MKLLIGAGLSALLLLGCTGTQNGAVEESVEVRAPSEKEVRPKNRPETDAAGLPATGSGIKVDDAARTSEAEAAKAVAPPTGAEQELGQTIATLGLLERDGFWLATPLVKTETPGRVVYLKSGEGANVTLLPNGTTEGSGSQLSLATMQALDIPLTELARIQVFAK